MVLAKITLFFRREDMIYNNTLCVSPNNATMVACFTTTISFLLQLTTTLVNAVLLTILVKSRQLLKQSMFYKLLLNIALADLSTGLVTDTTSIFYHIKEIFHYDIDNREAKLLHAALFSFNGVSVLTMSAICIDRIIAILSPIRYRNGLKIWKSISVLLLIWLVSLLLLVPYFLVGYISYLRLFSFVTVIIAFVSLVCASIIYKIFLKPVIKITCLTKNPAIADVNKQHATNNDTGTDTGEGRRCCRFFSRPIFSNVSDEVSSKRKKDRRGNEKRVNQSFLIMLVVFLVTYLPAAIMVIYMNTCHACDCHVIHVMRDATYLFILSSATWRPLNFILRLKTIRSRVQGLFCVKCSSSVNFTSSSDEKDI